MIYFSTLIIKFKKRPTFVLHAMKDQEVYPKMSRPYDGSSIDPYAKQRVLADAFAVLSFEERIIIIIQCLLNWFSEDDFKKFGRLFQGNKIFQDLIEKKRRLAEKQDLIEINTRLSEKIEVENDPYEPLTESQLIMVEILEQHILAYGGPIQCLKEYTNMIELQQQKDQAKKEREERMIKVSSIEVLLKLRAELDKEEKEKEEKEYFFFKIFKVVSPYLHFVFHFLFPLLLPFQVPIAQSTMVLTNTAANIALSTVEITKQQFFLQTEAVFNQLKYSKTVLIEDLAACIENRLNSGFFNKTLISDHWIKIFESLGMTETDVITVLETLYQRLLTVVPAFCDKVVKSEMTATKIPTRCASMTLSRIQSTELKKKQNASLAPVLPSIKAINSPMRSVVDSKASANESRNALSARLQQRRPSFALTPHEANMINPAPLGFKTPKRTATIPPAKKAFCETSGCIRKNQLGSVCFGQNNDYSYLQALFANVGSLGFNAHGLIVFVDKVNQTQTAVRLDYYDYHHKHFSLMCETRHWNDEWTSISKQQFISNQQCGLKEDERFESEYIKNTNLLASEPSTQMSVDTLFDFHCFCKNSSELSQRIDGLPAVSPSLAIEQWKEVVSYRETLASVPSLPAKAITQYKNNIYTVCYNAALTALQKVQILLYTIGPEVLTKLKLTSYNQLLEFVRGPLNEAISEPCVHVIDQTAEPLLKNKYFQSLTGPVNKESTELAVRFVELMANKTGYRLKTVLTGLKMSYDVINRTIVSQIFDAHLDRSTLQTTIRNKPGQYYLGWLCRSSVSKGKLGADHRNKHGVSQETTAPRFSGQRALRDEKTYDKITMSQAFLMEKILGCLFQPYFEYLPNFSGGFETFSREDLKLETFKTAAKHLHYLVRNEIFKPTDPKIIDGKIKNDVYTVSELRDLTNRFEQSLKTHGIELNTKPVIFTRLSE